MYGIYMSLLLRGQPHHHYNTHTSNETIVKESNVKPHIYINLVSASSVNLSHLHVWGLISKVAPILNLK